MFNTINKKMKKNKKKRTRNSGELTSALNRVVSIK